MEFDYDSERTYRRKRLTTLAISLLLFIFILVMFIVSMVLSRSVQYETCPSSIAFIKSVKIYYVFDDGKKTNTSFVDVTYGISDALKNRIIYENFTSVELAQKYQLQTIFSENGAIRIYKDCNVEKSENYYLTPVLIYKMGRWMVSAIIFGHLLCIASLVLLTYCCTVCLSNSYCMERLFSC